jgi:uncharacterized protein YpiB (UPF0302 family)
LARSVSIDKKRQFIDWFLHQYELDKREAAWLLSYLSYNEKLLARVHFVEHVHGLPRSMILSTKCARLTPFQYIKQRRVGVDVETAFYDICANVDEELYIALYFHGRETCPEYAAVLEGNPMEKQDLVKHSMLGLLAEMILDDAVKEFQRKQLYGQIDQALESRDEQAFLQLCQQLKQLSE